MYFGIGKTLFIVLRWDNNNGADKICKQLGYDGGTKGPRNAISEGSGHIHVVSWASKKFKDDVTNKIYKECKHSRDQAVVCKGGLGPTSSSGIANIVHDTMSLAKT